VGFLGRWGWGLGGGGRVLGFELSVRFVLWLGFCEGVLGVFLFCPVFLKRGVCFLGLGVWEGGRLHLRFGWFWEEVIMYI
jgi:hypothetical protein